MKKTYVQPKLAELGSVRELTLGASVGTHLDQNYPAGTGNNQLTFS